MTRCLTFECLDDDAASTMAPSRSDSLDDFDVESAVSLSSGSTCGSSQSSTLPVTFTTADSQNYPAMPVYPVPVMQSLFVPCMLAVAVPGYPSVAPMSTQIGTQHQCSNEASTTEQRAACETRWCAKKQRAYPVHSMPVASEVEWISRSSKRQAAIEVVKKTKEYKSCLASECKLPVAPDATDRSISKRSWEVEVMKFRDSVKELAKTLVSPVSGVDGTAKESRPRWADICDDEDEQRFPSSTLSVHSCSYALSSKARHESPGGIWDRF